MNITIFDEAVAIVGKTGSGKTYTAKFVVESFLLYKERVCILDPTGVWWGLRSTKDGKPGNPVVVFGGDHGDMPLTVDSADALGKLIGTTNMPAVIDMSDFTHAEHARFATRFLEALYIANRLPLRLVVDEADTFAPQNPQPNEAAMLGRMNAIVRRGRVKGFRPILITQRPQVLAKNVLSQVGALIAMKLTSPQDRKAIGAWIEGQADVEEGKRVLASLPKLERGEGWVWSPSNNYLVCENFPVITTFDSGKTPEVGKPMPVVSLAEVDLTAIRAALAIKAPEPAGKTLLRDVEERAAEIRAAAGEARAEGYRAGWIKGAEEGFRRGSELMRRAIVEGIEAGSKVDECDKRLDAFIRDSAPRIASAKPAMHKAIIVSLADEKPMPKPPTLIGSMPDRVTLSSGEKRIVDAVAWWHAINVTPTRTQVAFVAGYAVSGHFNRQVGELKSRGMIAYRNESKLDLTDAGRNVAARPGTTPTRAALFDMVRTVLNDGPLVRVFNALILHSGCTRETLAHQSGYEVSGHFNRQVGRLASLGIASYPAMNHVALSSIFEAFP